MTVQQSDSKLRKLAAGVGFVQSFAWIIMSMMCIVFYYSPDLPTTPSSYMGTVGALIYGMFLYNDVEQFPNQTFTGTIFNVFVWFYLLLDVFWLFVSIHLFRTNTPKALRAWGHCTLLISLLDFITFVILGADYNKCLDFAQNFTLIDETYVLALQQICANSILPPFIIAAKGFTLWVFNIALGIILDRKSRQL
ncbi:hypothetical protein Zmor_005151 [Zophobas morio]|uniref:Uncharacterized protein n=1 Tax=Zophobas morio TaxID=2755281 RepID=A0AA38IRK1_9CUCU|nr:hypothetical protein Zmor_005151 [Zophobas morio]